MSEGIAIAVRIMSTVMETINSTMLKPAMRLRRVRGFGALLCKVISSFKGWTSDPACKGGYETDPMQLPCQGQPAATDAKHSTFLNCTIIAYHKRRNGQICNKMKHSGYGV